MAVATPIPSGHRYPSAFKSSQASNHRAAGRPTNRYHSIGNPLWVIVIGMACFFGIAALILAWS